MKVARLADKSETSGAETYYERRLIRAPHGKEAIGLLEAYVCVECGWFEEYVINVDRIRWDRVDAELHTPTISAYR